MKKIASIFATVFTALLLAGSPYEAAAYTVADDYYGADDHGYDDVIGGSDLFDISRAELIRSGTKFTFDIYTEFTGKADDDLFSNYTRSGNGIGYGDLFLAGNWAPDDSENHYLADNATTGTQWEYVFSLDDRWAASGGTGDLYEVTDSGSILLSGDFLTGTAIWRDGQEVAYQQVTD